MKMATLPPTPSTTTKVTTMSSMTQQRTRRNSNGTIRKLTRFGHESENQWHVVPHRRDLTPREVEATWFTKDDYRRMRKNDERIIHTFLVHGCGDDDSHPNNNYNSDSDTNDEGCCTRGLEKRTPHASMMRKCHRLDVICAVLAEQERQRVHPPPHHHHHPMASSDVCVEAIAQTCRTVSEPAIRDALQWGAWDARVLWDVNRRCWKDPEYYSKERDTQNKQLQKLHQQSLVPLLSRQRHWPNSSRNNRMQRFLGIGTPFRPGPCYG
jgi:hypothetical protein